MNTKEKQRDKKGEKIKTRKQIINDKKRRKRLHTLCKNANEGSTHSTTYETFDKQNPMEKKNLNYARILEL